MDALHSLNLTNNTIVAFVSDHGCHFKTRNQEYKRTPHESSVRIPLALWGPGFDGGGEHSGAAGLINLPPPLLEAAGLPIPESMQAPSLLRLVQGPRDHWPESSFIQFGDYGFPCGRALRTQRWKYAVTIPASMDSCRHADFYEETHLFDLETDPYELNNLVDRRSLNAVREHLRARLLGHMNAAGEPPATILPHPAGNPAPYHPEFP